MKWFSYVDLVSLKFFQKQTSISFNIIKCMAKAGDWWSKYVSYHIWLQKWFFKVAISICYFLPKYDSNLKRDGIFLTKYLSEKHLD